MRTNPINLLLTGIAVADMLVMLEYVPFAAHMYLLKERPLQQEVRDCTVCLAHLVILARCSIEDIPIPWKFSILLTFETA